MITNPHPTPTELLACPFCDREPVKCAPEQHHPLVSIGCFECGMVCETQWLPEPEAIAAWNTRAATTLSAREDGWQLVPKFATDEMILAAWNAQPEDDHALRFSSAYAAMLVAAPKAPTAGEGREAK